MVPTRRLRRLATAACAAAPILLLAAGCATDDHGRHGESLTYPEARRVEANDVFHGESVPDPYRWLESAESEETRSWVRGQHELAHRYTGTEELERFRRRLVELQSFESYSLPVRRGDRVFYTRTPSGRSRGVLYVRDGDGKPRVLLDPDAEWPRGELRLSGYTPSRDGRHLAYLVSDGTSRWRQARIRDVIRGEDLPEELAGLTGWTSFAWLREGGGFYYTGHEPPEPGTEKTVELAHHRVRFHRLGSAQDDDATIYAPKDHPDWIFGAQVSWDGRWLVIPATEAQSGHQRVFVLDLRRSGAPVRPLIEPADSAYSFVGSQGGSAWFWTQSGASRGRLIAVDLERPGRDGWREVIAESEDTLLSVTLAGGRLIAQYVDDALPVARLFSLDGERIAELPMPGLGGYSLSGTPDDPEIFLRFGNFSDPGTVYRLHPERGELEIFRRPELTFDPESFETRQVFFTSRDGTRVPMFLAHKKGLELDGTAPVFMYGFGAWGWAAYPWFQPHVLLWLELGGVYALPGIRGGGEYGEEWHQAGIKTRKQSSIDDYLAAAEWLIDNGYTAPGKVVANGGSASGLLAGAALIQGAELFGAVVIDHPALDMLRAESFQGGNYRVPEYGSVANLEEYRALRALSPYHNLKPGTCYPPLLLTLGEHDVSTVPAHGYKFVAALQHEPGCDHPALLQMVWKGGHYVFGHTPEERADTLARQVTFIRRSLGIGS